MVPHRRVSEAAFEGIPDNAAVWARPRRIHPEFRVPFDKKLMQLALRDTRFDGDVRQLLVEIENPVEPRKIEQHAIPRRHTRTIAPVLAAADRIDWNQESIGNLDTPLNLGTIAGPHNRLDLSLGCKRSGTGLV